MLYSILNISFFANFFKKNWLVKSGGILYKLREFILYETSLMLLQAFIQDPAFKKKFVLEKLLCHYLNKSRSELRIDADQEIPSDIEQKIRTDYRAYEEEDKPLEYLLGFVEFFGQRFIVNENTLVPRPETEYMITAITEYLAQAQLSDAVLLDIGTGSGVLGCSVVLQNPTCFRSVFFSDISKDALLVAKQNYDRLIAGLSHEMWMLQSDLCAFVENYPEQIKNKNLILVANLPYIPDKTFEENAPSNVQKREPKLAFVGGDDGLDLYRKMFAQLQESTKDAKSLTMFLEMMTWQVELLRKEFGEIMEFEEVKTFHFNIRIVKARFKWAFIPFVYY